MLDDIDAREIPSRGLTIADANDRHSRICFVEVRGIGAALTAMMIDMQEIDSASADHRMRAARRNGVDHRSLDIDLCRRSAGARIGAATEVAGPQIIETAVLDQKGD